MTLLLLALLTPPTLPSNNPVPPPNPAPVQPVRPWQPGFRPPVFPVFPVYYPPLWYGYGFYSDPFFAPPPTVVVVPQPVIVSPPNPARADEAAARATATAPALLSVEFPAPAEVWLDGEKQPADACSLSSPALRLGATYTFKIRARWVEAGTTYEVEQTSTVKAGERGKLAVYAGTPVK